MELDTEVKLAVYRHFADGGLAPDPGEVAERVESDVDSVLASYGNLQKERVLVLGKDGSSIRMAPPFSGVPTQHLVTAGGVEYFANCAWDALGIPAALRKDGVVRSRCEHRVEALVLHVGLDGPGPSDWVFHCQVPAAQWWEDIVFT